jgi:glycosyltransferase involved in cell wall biosynthesis
MVPPALRVLHVLDSLSIGGTERNAVRLARELQRAGVGVQFAVFRDGPLRAELDSAGIQVVRHPLSSFYSVAFVREARRLGRIIEDGGIDLIHAHDRGANVFATASRMLGARVPMIASKRWDSRADPWPMRMASRFALRSATRVLANSHAVARTAATDEGVPPSKIHVIPNFVDDDLFGIRVSDLRARTRAELGIGPEQPVLVCVANLRPVKNQALLLEALAASRASVPGLLLLLVGDGPSREDLERRSRALDLDGQVRFLGVRPDGWQFHAAADISVLSSVTEGFPNALVEAHALGIPVIATAVGGVPEIVEDQKTGLLVPEGDAPALTAALVSLLGDAARRRAMGVAGRAAAAGLFGREQVIRRVLELYRSVVPTP